MQYPPRGATKTQSAKKNQSAKETQCTTKKCTTPPPIHLKAFPPLVSESKAYFFVILFSTPPSLMPNDQQIMV